jgi:hypothetical protein
MKLRFTLSLLLTIITWSAFSGTEETVIKKKVTHHVQFLLGNYVGLQANRWQSENSLSAMYSYTIGFGYEAEFTHIFALRTGINYFTYGIRGPGLLANEIVPLESFFTSYIHIPVNLVMHKDLRRGRIVFAAGPDIYLPTNTFGRTTGHYDFFLIPTRLLLAF